MNPEDFQAMLNGLPIASHAAPVVPRTVNPAFVQPDANSTPVRTPAAAGKKRREPTAAQTQVMAQSEEAGASADDLFAQMFAPQQASADDLRRQAKELSERTPAEPYNPILAMTDVFLGTDTAQRLKPQGLTAVDIQKRVAELTDKAGDVETGIGKQKVDLITSKNRQESEFAKMAMMAERQLASQNGALSPFLQMREDSQLQSTLEKFGNQMTGYEKSRNMKAMVTNQLGRIAGMRGLLKDKPYDDLTPQQVAELAEGIVPLVSGTNSGAGSEGRLNNFLQKNFKMNIANFMSYIQSEPKMANQGKFIELLEDMLNREGAVRQRELDAERRRVLPVYARLYKNPNSRESFYQVAAARGMSPDEVDAHFDPKNRGKLIQAFNATGDVPGSLPAVTSSGDIIPGYMQTAFEVARKNKNNAKYTDKQLLQAIKQQPPKG